MSGDPGDASGGDFTGGDDGEINLIAPSITSGVQNLNGNTYASGFSYTFQLNANPGSPDTSITWSLNGIGTLTQSGFYTFPSLSQGQTASGQLVFTVSNNNGSSSQTWSYNITNTQQPFFTNTAPAPLVGNSSTDFVSVSYQFSANRGAPNTESPLTWSISPNDYVVLFEGASDTVRTLSILFAQGTIVNGTYTVSISNANGSASQSWNYDINIGTTSGGGGDGGYWALESTNYIVNTNANGVRMTGLIMANNKLIIHEGNLGWIYQITDGLTQTALNRPAGVFIESGRSYGYYKILDGDGRISWNHLSGVPSFITSSGGSTTLAALATVFGSLAAGALAGGVVSWIWNKVKNTGVDVPKPEGAQERNSDGKRIGSEQWDTISGRPIASDKNGVRYDLGIKGDVMLTSNVNFYLESSSGCIILDPDDSLHFFEDPLKNNLIFASSSKTFYGKFKSGNYGLDETGLTLNNDPIVSNNRIKVGNYELRAGDETTGGLFYNGLKVGIGVGGTETSSVPLSGVQDGRVQGTSQASSNRLANLTRRYGSKFSEIFPL